MKKKLFYSLVFLFSLNACKQEEKPQVQHISVEEMLEAIEDDNIQLIDVRTPEEFQEAKIKNAQNLCVTNDDFKERALKFDKEKPVYLYCKSGVRSAKAAEILKKMGFKQIYEMPGGMDEWQDKGMDIDKS